jgi:hypothetical protein
MKHMRTDLSSKLFPVPRLCTRFWFLVRPQLLTRV